MRHVTILQDYLFPHSIEFSGGVGHCSSKASRREDLEIEQPVASWDCSSCHFSPTLASMLGATLIRYPVVAGCEPGEPGLWASLRRVQALHREPLPLAGILRWIQQGAGCRQLRGCEHGRPAGLASPDTSAGRARRAPFPPCWPRERSSGGAVAPAQPPASPCAGARGSAGCGTGSVRP